MTEEKQEKKKRGIVKRIFKWIGLGLLTALILGALVFDAPWKVIVLLLIILAAHTILPKGTVKWFWLSVAVVVVLLIIWVFLPDKNGNWQPYEYNFDEELAAIEAKYVIPDELNAALLYDKLLEALDVDSNAPEFFVKSRPSSRDEPWRSADHPETADWLKGHQKTIDALLEISRIEKCSFPIVATLIDPEYMKRSPKMRRWAFLLVSAANNDLAENRIKEGFQKNMALMQMGKHLYQQPSTTDWLVSIAIEAIGINQLKTFVVTEDAAEEYLSSIEKALTDIKYDWSSDFFKILTSDKLSTKRKFARYYEMNPKGRIRLSRDPWAEVRAHWKKSFENGEFKDSQYRTDLETFVYLSYWQRKLLKAQTILLWFYLPSSPEKSAELIDCIYQKYYQMTKPDFDWTKQPRELPTTSQFKFRLNCYRTIELLAGASDKLYYRNHEIYLRHQMAIRANRLIIALRRYKNKHSHWPENLDEVKSLALTEIFVDPINGNSFVYKLTEENFTLYSKGKNNIDEDGKRDRWGEEKTGADDWPIWPPKQSQKPKGQETYKPERNTDSVGKAIQEQNIAELPGQKIEGAKMIVDRIENAHLYAALNDRFTKAFEILTDRTLSSKQDGRYEVDGDKLYYIVQHYTTKLREECKLEAHRKYIDVQFVVSGQEILYYVPLKGLKIETPYDQTKDVAFYKVPNDLTAVNLRPGMFCILFPQDAHIPCCQFNGPSDVHKVVIKVKIN
jgi:YhcH/YjgK/YiaL family protein